MRYYIADSHFFHESMNVRMDKRGFETVNEMNDYMIMKWNSRVNKKDEIMIIGDFSIGKARQTEDILKQLNGQKYLVIGNHDKFLKDKTFDKSLFREIAPYMEYHDNKRKVILCHYPIVCYNGQYRIREKDKSGFYYMLHGHVHDTFDQALIDQYIINTQNTVREINGSLINIPCNIINCFCKWSDYVPLTLDEWISFHNTRLSTGYPIIQKAI